MAKYWAAVVRQLEEAHAAWRHARVLEEAYALLALASWARIIEEYHGGREIAGVWASRLQSLQASRRSGARPSTGRTPGMAVPTSRPWSLVLVPEPRPLQVVGGGVGAVPVHRNSPTSAVIAAAAGPVRFRRPHRSFHLTSATEGLLLPLSRALRASLGQPGLLSDGAAFFFRVRGCLLGLAPLLLDAWRLCTREAQTPAISLPPWYSSMKRSHEAKARRARRGGLFGVK